MASLMEELLQTLEDEKEIYEQLIPISERKTKVLIKNDLAGLEKITAQEQFLIDKVNMIDKKRENVTKDIGVVLNRNPKELDLTTLARLMESQPSEKKRIASLHDSLSEVMRRLVDINQKNKELIENSLEMIEFNMNFIQSTRMSPGSNNYNRNASNSYTADMGRGAFDAKQ